MRAEPFIDNARPVSMDARVCTTCGMVLLGQGLQRGGHTYCCPGCLPDATKQEHSATERILEVTRTIFINAPVDEAAFWLADIRLLPFFERTLKKVKLVAIAPDRRDACATITGRVGLLPFRMTAHFHALEGGGFQITMTEGRLLHALSGIYTIRPAGHGCVVKHIEHYEFSGSQFGPWAIGIWRWYVIRTMDDELRELKRLVEG